MSPPGGGAGGGGLHVDDLDPDPLVQFGRWLAEAVAAGGPDATAMVLATVDDGGRPAARSVLLKGVEDGAFVFFTNLESPKARHLAARPAAALTFRWPAPPRQVRVTGTASPLPAAASDAYFATRPRGSQIGAWASPQSQVLADRSELERRVAEVDARFAGRPVPRPSHWGGVRVVPDAVELWQGRPDRLHDRFRYEAGADGWRIVRLAP